MVADSPCQGRIVLVSNGRNDQHPRSTESSLVSWRKEPCRSGVFQEPAWPGNLTGMRLSVYLSGQVVRFPV